MAQLTVNKWIRVSLDLNKKLSKLKEYSIVESKFIRLAIEEKLQRDLPKLKEEKNKIKLPF